MKTISIDQNLARDLIKTNLRVINAEIAIVLENWKYSSPELFISDTREGRVPEAESDAIVITNLLDRKIELERILNDIGDETHRENATIQFNEAIKRVIEEDHVLLERLAR
ncbi:MAG: hypothetical protein ACTSRU_01910 [Candidatus Hodarchaeales archaeon]